MADVTFAEVLERLGRIRGQLEATSSPEEVLALEEEAEALAQRGREVLERRVGQRMAQRSAHPDVQDDWPRAPQQEQQTTAARPAWPGSVKDVERATEVVAREQDHEGRPTEIVARDQSTEIVTRDQSTEIVARDQQSETERSTEVVDLTDAPRPDPSAEESSAEPGSRPAAQPAAERASSTDQPTEVIRTVD